MEEVVRLTHPPSWAADFVEVPRVTQEPMEQDEEDRLVALFWEGFGVPDLHSERGNELYYDWVETEEWIAGPIYTVANGGTWDYVFTAQDGSFAAIGDIEALLRWYTTPIERFRKRVEEYHPRSEAGRIDRETLLHKVAILHELGGLGATIHTLRQGVKPSRDTQEDL